MTRHVVFGTGQVGRLVVEQLVARGVDVTAVNRSGGPPIAGADVVAGDASDVDFTTRATAGADAVYFCLNASAYDRWAIEFPPLQRGVLAGARAAGARLVVLDNLYAYGPTNGRDLVETLPARPTSTKAATRAAMTEDLLAAHRAGDVEVAIGRASDYFGPGTRQSALGETVFATALSGRAAQVMGRTDLPHSYSYTPDVAAALITLATEPGSAGAVWHLPVAEARTTRQIIDHVYRAPATDHGASPPGPHAARARRRQAGDARVPPHALPVHAALGRRRHEVPHRLRRRRHAPRCRPRHHPRLVPDRRRSRKDMTMDIQTTRRLAAASMAGAATLAIAGFTALGAIFDYPAILEEPTAEILAAFRRHEVAVVSWFLVLTISAGLLAPIGILLGRIAGPTRPLDRRVGIAAATVQVIGLSRWVLLVPGISDDAIRPGQAEDAHHTFELLHTWLGEYIGETSATPSRPRSRSSSSSGSRSASRRGGCAGSATPRRCSSPAASSSRSASRQRASPTSSATSSGACGSSPWPGFSGRPGSYARGVLRISVLGPVEVRRDGRLVPVPGRQDLRAPRAPGARRRRARAQRPPDRGPVGSRRRRRRPQHARVEGLPAAPCPGRPGRRRRRRRWLPPGRRPDPGRRHRRDAPGGRRQPACSTSATTVAPPR